MDASTGSSPPHSQENPPEHGGDQGEVPAEEIGGGEAADDFLFTEDTFPSLPEFPCLSSPCSSTFSSSSSSNSSNTYTNAVGRAGGGGAVGAAAEPSEPAAAGEGFDALDDVDILDFASLSMPWDSEPFPDVSMMLEDAMSAPPHPVGDGRSEERAVPEVAAGGEEETCMDASAAAGTEDLPRFFMEWLTNNRENISAEDLRSVRLRRSTIEAAAARLGGGRQGNMQLLKLILTWVQNHHLQRKRPRDVMEEAAGLHGQGQGQLSSPGANTGYEFPAAAAGGGQEMATGGGTSWMPYQQPFTPPSYGGGGEAGQYPFHQSSSTSSVVVNSQPFSPPAAVGDMHAAGGGNMAAWSQQYVPFPAPSTGSYPMPPPVVPQQPFSPGFGGQYTGGAGQSMAPAQRMVGVEPSATKEARKKRMARQRRLTCLQQQRSQQLNLGQIQAASIQPQEPSPRSAHSAPVTPSSAGVGWGFLSPATQQQVLNPLSKYNSSARAPMQQATPPPDSAAALPAKPTMPSGAPQDDSPQRSVASDKRQGARADKNLQLLLQKVLKQSDVGSLGRIVLPKKEAEIHLPELKSRDGISIPMEDIGTSRVWNMRYRFWPNNKSRMYLLENTGDFVRSNELQEGDFIVIYSDAKSGKYLIRGVKVRRSSQQELGSSAAGKHNKQHGCPGPDKASTPDQDASVVIIDGTSSKPDGGACKGRSPQGVRRARQGAASMSQMAVSI